MQCSLLNTQTNNTYFPFTTIQPSDLLDGRSFYRYLQEGESSMGMMNAIPFVKISSAREGSWRWFPSSLCYPWANSDRQVA